MFIFKMKKCDCIKYLKLVEAAEGSGGVFTRVIEKYYKGRRDRKTVEILGKEEGK